MKNTSRQPLKRIWVGPNDVGGQLYSALIGQRDTASSEYVLCFRQNTNMNHDIRKRFSNICYRESNNYHILLNKK